MGLTYTFCYCTANRKCKSRSHADKNRMAFDSVHWGDIRTNSINYLNEEVCVPGSSNVVKSPTELNILLESFLVTLKDVRTVEEGSADDCLSVMQNAFKQLSAISSLCSSIVGSQNISKLEQEERLLNFNKSKIENDPYIEVGELIALSCQRATYELIESKNSNDSTYVFHHLGIVLDTVSELYRLVGEASFSLSTENFLPESHPHNALLERRREADGILD